jgi:hypothetical protein
MSGNKIYCCSSRLRTETLVIGILDSVSLYYNNSFAQIEIHNSYIKRNGDL